MAAKNKHVTVLTANARIFHTKLIVEHAITMQFHELMSLTSIVVLEPYP